MRSCQLLSCSVNVTIQVQYFSVNICWLCTPPPLHHKLNVYQVFKNNECWINSEQILNYQLRNCKFFQFQKRLDCFFKKSGWLILSGFVYSVITVLCCCITVPLFFQRVRDSIEFFHFILTTVLPGEIMGIWIYISFLLFQH